MGIYTNVNESYNTVNTLDYKKYDININENMNFFTMGMEAVMECEINRAAFDKAIALEELAAFEQTGGTDVLYEGFSLKGIWEKIKAFFKAIWEKAKKIFAAFMGKMDTIFRGNEGFAKKYLPKIKDNWANASKAWKSFSGYVFNANGMYEVLKDFDDNKSIAALVLTNLNSSDPAKDTVAKFLAQKNDFSKLYSLVTNKQDAMVTNAGNLANGNGKKLTDDKAAELGTKISDTVREAKEKFADKKSEFEKDLVTQIAGKTIEYKEGEFNKALYKAFRNGEDSKKDLSWSDVTTMFSNAEALASTISNFTKVKEDIKKAEKDLSTGFEKLISEVDKASAEVNKLEATAKVNEALTSVASFYKDLWGYEKETYITVLAANAQAKKDSVSQAKAIAIKIAGMGAAKEEEKKDDTNKAEEEKKDENSGTEAGNSGEGTTTTKSNESYSYDFIGNVEIV